MSCDRSLTFLKYPYNLYSYSLTDGTHFIMDLGLASLLPGTAPPTELRETSRCKGRRTAQNITRRSFPSVAKKREHTSWTSESVPRGAGKMEHTSWTTGSGPSGAEKMGHTSWTKLFIDHVVNSEGHLKQHWVIFEWQHRGSVHAHGLLWMDDCPVSSVEELLSAEGREEEKRELLAYFDKYISDGTRAPSQRKSAATSRRRPTTRSWPIYHRHTASQPTPVLSGMASLTIQLTTWAS